MRPIRKIHGFSLLEVLIALLIFTFGLLGLAGLLVVSVKTNHSAYLRTQASFLAQSIADRMRANPAALWAASGDGSYVSASYPITGTASACAAGCSVEDVAKRDKIIWSQQLTDLLPSSAATIACARNSSVSVPAVSIAQRAPYDGLCTVTITWAEANLKQGSETVVPTQTFAWVFQP